MPSFRPKPGEHTRGFPQRTTPLEEHPAVIAVPHRCGPATPSRLCPPVTTVETASQEYPPPRGFAPSLPVGHAPLVARCTLDPILPGLVSPPRSTAHSLPRAAAEAVPRHGVATVCQVLPPEPEQPSEEACRLSPAELPEGLNGSSPCWMLGHPLSGWSDAEAPFLQ